MSRALWQSLASRTWLEIGARSSLSFVGLGRPVQPALPSRGLDDHQPRRRCMPVEAPTWLNPGDTSWQMTAATLVGLMSVPGLVVLYGGVMQKRWSINSMMLAFAAFSVVLIIWVLYAFKMGFGSPFHGVSHSGFFGNFIGKPGPVLSHTELQHQANIPLIGTMALPNSVLIYFQLDFAAITPLMALGSVLGRVNIKDLIPSVV